MNKEQFKAELEHAIGNVSEGQSPGDYVKGCVDAMIDVVAAFLAQVSASENERREAEIQRQKKIDGGNF